MGKYDNLTRHVAKAVETRPFKQRFFAPFFPLTDIHNQELVEFDDKAYKNGIAPFVNPLKDGKPVEREGFNNNILKLPTIKPSKLLTSKDLDKKPFGGTVYDATAKNAIARQLVTGAVDDNEARLDVRLEVMRTDALFNNSLTIVGEGEDRVVTFGRAAANTVDLGAGNYWDEDNTLLDGDVRSFIALIAAAGKSATHIVGRSETMSVIVGIVKGLTDYRRVENGALKFENMLDVDGSIYEGTFLNLELWSYDGVYVDAANATQKAVPAKKIVVLSAQNENEMSYGYASDIVLELDLAESFDVSARNVITKLKAQSSAVEIESVLTAAPLLKDPNSTLVATILV